MSYRIGHIELLLSRRRIVGVAAQQPKRRHHAFTLDMITRTTSVIASPS